MALVSESFLRRFGLNSRDRLTEIAEEFGIDVLYRPAESYDGALLRIRDAQRGCIVINSRIREESRKRFTLAHEIGHFVLPGQQEVSAPCKQQRIENWDADLYRPELEANRFAVTVREMTDVLRTQHDVRPRLDRCEHEITALKLHLGLG